MDQVAYQDTALGGQVPHQAIAHHLLDQVPHQAIPHHLLDQVPHQAIAHHLEDQVLHQAIAHHLEDQVLPQAIAHHLEDQVPHQDIAHHLEDQVPPQDIVHHLEDQVPPQDIAHLLVAQVLPLDMEHLPPHLASVLLPMLMTMELHKPHLYLASLPMEEEVGTVNRCQEKHAIKCQRLCQFKFQDSSAKLSRSRCPGKIASRRQDKAVKMSPHRVARVCQGSFLCNKEGRSKE